MPRLKEYMPGGVETRSGIYTTKSNNQTWLAALWGPQSEQAISDLRGILVCGLRRALFDPVRDDLEMLVEDLAQEALLKILANLDSFRGEGSFTSWAQKIAVNVAYSELRHSCWKDLSLQKIIEWQERNGRSPAILSDVSASPELEATQNIMLEVIQQLIDEELTERRRLAIQTVIIDNVPMEEAARRLETNRNALYKLIFDAREHLRTALLRTGISPKDVLAMFA